MNRFVHVMMAMALLSVAAVRDSRSAEIAEAVPADVMVYAEMGEEPAQALLLCYRQRRWYLEGIYE